MVSHKDVTFPINNPTNYRKMRVHMGGCECQLTRDVIVSSWSPFGGGGFNSESESESEYGRNVFSDSQITSSITSLITSSSIWGGRGMRKNLSNGYLCKLHLAHYSPVLIFAKCNLWDSRLEHLLLQTPPKP